MQPLWVQIWFKLYDAELYRVGDTGRASTTATRVLKRTLVEMVRRNGVSK